MEHKSVDSNSQFVKTRPLLGFTALCRKRKFLLRAYLTRLLEKETFQVEVTETPDRRLLNTTINRFLQKVICLQNDAISKSRWLISALVFANGIARVFCFIYL